MVTGVFLLLILTSIYLSSAKLECDLKTWSTMGANEFPVMTNMSSSGYERKITNKEHDFNAQNHMNRKQWHCGSGASETAGYYTNFCWAKISDINMCCAVHDDCYSYEIQGGQERCDSLFCDCMDRAIESSSIKCNKVWTSSACLLVKSCGKSFYGKPDGENTKMIEVQLPALNKTVESNYLELYETCTGMNTTISSCAYNHMLCYMRLLPDKIPQSYEDCVDYLIDCLDDSINFLTSSNEQCLIQLEVTIKSIADDSKISGIPVIREAKKTRLGYKYIDVLGETNN